MSGGSILNLTSIRPRIVQASRRRHDPVARVAAHRGTIPMHAVSRVHGSGAAMHTRCARACADRLHHTPHAATACAPCGLSMAPCGPTPHANRPKRARRAPPPTPVRQVEYAVRGEIVRRAQQIADDLATGRGGPHPFDKVVWCNIGNPQILGQKPITYFRQVLSLCEYPEVRCHGGRGARGRRWRGGEGGGCACLGRGGLACRRRPRVARRVG